MSKQRNIRKRRAVDEEDDILEDQAEQQTQQPLSAEEIKLLQKQRQRRTGVDATSLAGAGAKAPTSLPDIPAAPGDEGVLHAAFNKERTRLLNADDDPEMQRYVEEQLAKRLGKELPDHDSKGSKRAKTVEELALEAAVPKKKDLFDEPGAVFVAGVAEVPLGVEHKLRNIEATEAAKAALLAKGKTAARGFDRGQEEEEDEYGGGNRNFKRGQFPVRFGKMDEKEQALLADIRSKKAAQRARAQERKKEKQKEFKGFF